MARTVFFSFHYQEDWSRMWNVRKSGQFRRVAGSENNVRLFLPRDRWETVKRQGEKAIKSWIDEGLKYSSVTVVLIGQYTYQRKYVKYEIQRSEEEGKGILGVYVHGLRNLDQKLGVKGPSPFEFVPLSRSYRTYDWVRDGGFDNFSSWVEQAAKAASR